MLVGNTKYERQFDITDVDMVLYSLQNNFIDIMASQYFKIFVVGEQFRNWETESQRSEFPCPGQDCEFIAMSGTLPTELQFAQ